MPSGAKGLLLLWLLVIPGVTACGEEQGGGTAYDAAGSSDVAQAEIDPCEVPGNVGSWSTVGDPFIRSWCRGCHSRDLPTGSRGNAPLDINFDKKTDVDAKLERIVVRVEGRTMPPSMVLQPEEVEEFLRWISCGAP